MRSKKIRNEISKYILKEKTFNIGSRALAIKKAIKSAIPNETIIIAGKGHEKKQIYKNKIINISDKEIVRKTNIKIKSLNKKKQNYFLNNLILEKILGKSNPFKFDGISIDSRSIKKGNLFLTMRGQNYHGDKFIEKALKKGAGCVVSNSNLKNNKKIIKVKKPILFLNQFAKLKRDYISAKIIAITGSAGKTSLKNLIKDLLQNIGKTYSSPKSFNNHLGVPISLSNINYNDDFGIFEVGMSRPGEIRSLTLIQPHIGVITNIGEAHLENFKNINGIFKAKSEIIEKIQKGGKIILNRDDKFFGKLSKKLSYII